MSTYIGYNYIHNCSSIHAMQKSFQVVIIWLAMNINSAWNVAEKQWQPHLATSAFSIVKTYVHNW
jgi:hypothetical protein